MFSEFFDDLLQRRVKIVDVDHHLVIRHVVRQKKLMRFRMKRHRKFCEGLGGNPLLAILNVIDKIVSESGFKREAQLRDILQ